MGNARVARDYYGILGIDSDAGPDEIKRAYRRLARELHPDVNPDAAAQERFAEVSAAYEVLSDPEKRRIVDLGGDPLANGAAAGGGGDPFSAFGLGDIMDAFFGGGAAGGGRGRGPRSRVQPGADGRVRSRRTVGVRIPAGVADGMRVRLAHQGEVGPGGGPAGDLYVEVDEVPHDVFTRDGADLHCTVQLPMTAAALGTTLDLPTLQGTEELRIDAGTQTGTVRTLRGKGMPRLRSTGRVDGQGDLMVHVDVVVPTKLDAKQTELLRQLAQLRGEEQPDLAGGNRNGHGIFSRLRDSFSR